MSGNGADNPGGFPWDMAPRDPDEVAAAERAAALKRADEAAAAEQAAANRRANEQAAATQAAALDAQRRRANPEIPGALHPATPAAPTPPPAPDYDEDPFAIFTPPPTEAAPVVPPAAPWVPGAFTAQNPIIPSAQQAPPVQPAFPSQQERPAQPASPAHPLPPVRPGTPVEPADPLPDFLRPDGTPAAPVDDAPAPPLLVPPPALVLPPEPQWPLPAPGTPAPGAAAPMASWDQPTEATPYVDVPTEPSAYVDVPTEAYDVHPEAQTYPWDPSSGAVPAPDPALAGIYPAQPVGLPAPIDEAPFDEAPTTKLPSSDFDSLFGDDQFKAYDDESLLSPLVPGKTDTPPPAVLPREPLTSTQRTLLWVAGSLVAALAFVGLFILGTSLSGPAEILPPVAQETPGGEDPVDVPVVGPLAPGVHPWDSLLGTECLEPYVSAWEKEYTVVDCATPHSAQMLATGVFDGEKDAAGTEFPGVETLVTRATKTCTSRDVINYGKASNYTDIEVTASVPANAEQWTEGAREYYCFATRSSGDTLKDTITKTPKAETADDAG